MTKGRVIGLCGYVAVCLAQPIGEICFDLQTIEKLSLILAAMRSLSNPTYQVIAGLLFLGVGAALLPGILVAWILVPFIAVGILIAFYVIKAAIWIAALGPWGTFFVILVPLLILGKLVHAHWERVIEGIARSRMAIRWLLGLDRGGASYYGSANVTSRIGGVLIATGAITLILGASQRAPVWFSQIRRLTTPATVKHYVIIAPVNKWSDTLHTPDSKRYFPDIVVDDNVFVQDDVGVIYQYGPKSGVYLKHPKSLRWKSRTSRPVSIHVFSTAPIITSAETNRPNAFIVIAPVRKWSAPVQIDRRPFICNPPKAEVLIQKDHEHIIHEDGPVHRVTTLGTNPISTLRFQAKHRTPVTVVCEISPVPTRD